MGLTVCSISWIAWVYWSRGWLNEVCYGPHGCFRSTAPFDNTGGYLPQSPEDIQVEFLLYTRENKVVPKLISANDDFLSGSHLSTNRKSVFIIHGWQDNPYEPWVVAMKDALITQADVNVIAVKWGSDAATACYKQAAADTRIVGVLIRELLLSFQGAKDKDGLKDIHLVGHSLGAHVAGYAGEGLNLGRITGLDPAGPSFADYPPLVRLDPSDAIFVDVIHTDGQAPSYFNSWLGTEFGILIPMGHVDFYPNGGMDQSSCNPSYVDYVTNLRKTIACDHSRARDYFTESITSSCRFTSSLCLNYDAFKRGDCPCGKSPCASMGFFARANDTRGKYFLDTVVKSPFCRIEKSL